MADYTGLTSVFEVAIPQVWKAKYPDFEWSRRIEVSDEAEDNFVITRSAVLISPKAIGDKLNLFDFCTRITRAAWDFDHLAEQREQRLREEWLTRLTRDLDEIEKRWGIEGLDELLMDALNGRGYLITDRTRKDN